TVGPARARLGDVWAGFYHDAAQSRELGLERAPYAATVVVVHVDDPGAPGREGLPREPRQLRSVLHVAGTDPEEVGVDPRQVGVGGRWRDHDQGGLPGPIHA